MHLEEKFVGPRACPANDALARIWASSRFPPKLEGRAKSTDRHGLRKGLDVFTDCPLRATGDFIREAVGVLRRLLSFRITCLLKVDRKCYLESISEKIKTSLSGPHADTSSAHRLIKRFCNPNKTKLRCTKLLPLVNKSDGTCAASYEECQESWQVFSASRNTLTLLR